MLNAISDVVIERLLQGLVDTLTMVGLSAGLALLLGLPLAVFLVLSAPGALLASPRLNRVLGSLVNGFRATPFIILLVALIPFTRWVTGTTIGVWAAVVPLTISATPFFARIAEVGLNEVDKGLIEAGFTSTVVSMIGASAMAGAVGAGGLGDIAIRYGYQRFDTQVMVLVIVLLIALVCSVQLAGDRWVRHLRSR